MSVEERNFHPYRTGRTVALLFPIAELGAISKEK